MNKVNNGVALDIKKRQVARNADNDGLPGNGAKETVRIRLRTVYEPEEYTADVTHVHRIPAV
jgi:hypothetical protein